MGWVWSDELAATLRDSAEFADLIPPAWSAQPTAFATTDGEARSSAGRRLLGIPTTEPAADDGRLPCTCGREAAVD